MNNQTQNTVARHEVLRNVRSLISARPLLLHEAQGIAERQAMRLLELLSIEEGPVDIDAIAGLPRLEVKLVTGLPVSGFSEWSKSRWLIVIRADEPVQRRRFTLAHELKHILDNPFVQGLYPDPAGEASQKRAEAICDYFAGCLLMPRAWVKRAFTTGHQDLRDLADSFGVSQAAMSVRLWQLGLTMPTPRCFGLSKLDGLLDIGQYTRALSPSFALASAQGCEEWS